MKMRSGYSPKPGQTVKSMACIALECRVSKAQKCPALRRVASIADSLSMIIFGSL